LADKKTILCDVDEVVAGLLPAWIARYNATWDDNLQLNAITGWHIPDFVKPECGERIYDLLDATIYESVQPAAEAREGLWALRAMGHRVVFVTSSNAATAGPKMDWLVHHGFATDRKDIVIAHDKSLVRGDVLIDDGLHNLKAFPGPAILFTQPHNASYTRRGLRRANTWADVVRHVCELFADDPHDF
jgi:5'(3')-deoxyribonucleotidase